MSVAVHKWEKGTRFGAITSWLSALFRAKRAATTSCGPYRVGEFTVNYDELSQEQLNAARDPAWEELLKNSKVVSVKAEPC